MSKTQMKMKKKKVNPLEEEETRMTSRKRKGNDHLQRSGLVNPPAWNMIWIKSPFLSWIKFCI